MNQHLMCVLAQTAVGIYQNDPDMYTKGILRGTTNPEVCQFEGCDHVTCNRNRTGAISVLFRYNTINALTGESIRPRCSLPKWDAIWGTVSVTLPPHPPSP